MHRLSFESVSLPQIEEHEINYVCHLLSSPLLTVSATVSVILWLVLVRELTKNKRLNEFSSNCN